jgi:alpha-glucosidase
MNHGNSSLGGDPRRIVRWALRALLCASALGGSGCGDDDGPQAGDLGADAAEDVGGDGGDGDLGDVGDAGDDGGPDAGDSDADEADASDVADDTGGGVVATFTVNGWTIETDQAAGTWTLTTPDGQRALDSTAQPLRLALGAPFARTASGNFDIQLEGGRARNTWYDAATPAWGDALAPEGGALRLPWDVADADGEPVARLTLRFETEGEASLRLTVEAAPAGDAELGPVELRWSCDAAESFFGLGTQTVGLDLRGRTYPLWTQEQGIGKPEGGGLFPLNNTPEAAYAPMGIWHSSAGYSAVLATDVYNELSLCDEGAPGGAGTVSLRAYPEAPAVVLVPGADARARLGVIVRDYLGTPDPQPAWLLAPWNDAVGGPERVADVANLLRENDIPSSAIWTEDWIGGQQGLTGYSLTYSWDWSQELYPDLPADIEALQADGFAFLGYFNPFMPRTASMFEEGYDNGYLVNDENGEPYLFPDPFFRETGLVDLSDEGAQEWLGGWLDIAADDLGIDGWMVDFAEWLPHDAVLEDGRTGWEAHNTYPLAWQRANREALRRAHAGDDAGNWVYFARSGWASVNGGTGGIAPSMWAGDQNTDWGYDDGLPSTVPVALHAGLAGVGVFGTDIAGFTTAVSPPTTKELFFRWTVVGAFHALMRTHHGSDECRNWVFDRDEETLAHFRRWTSVHALLYPYLAERLAEYRAAGVPIMRHPILVTPEQPTMWAGDEYRYFLGDDLLVSPVLVRGVDEWTVTLPGRGWWPLFGEAPLSGEADAGGGDGSVRLTVAAPATEAPVFVRPGAVVPLLPQVVDSFYGATTEGVTTLDDVAGSLRLALYPAGDGTLVGRPTAELSVTGSGWDDVDVDWSAAEVDGEAVPACVDEDDEGPCHGDDELRLVAVGEAAVAVAVEGATLVLTLADEEPLELRLGIAGHAWGEWAEPTPLTDLDPDITPPCELE